MKRIASILVIALISFSAYAQDIVKAEKAALKCIEKSLSVAEKDIGYLFNAADEYNRMLSGFNTIEFKKKKNEVDSILKVCGFYGSGDFNVLYLKQCMEAKYDLNGKGADTASAYHKLLEHLNHWANNKQLYSNLSPTIQLEAISMIIPENKREEDFYKAISFVLFQGIMSGFDLFAESQKNGGTISLSGTEQQDEEIVPVIHVVDDDEDIELEENENSNLEILSIVEDDVEIEEIEFDEVDRDISPCSDEFFVIVEKMPEYPGGMDALKEKLHVHSSEIEGKVFVQFVVNCEGKVVSPKVVRGMGATANAAAIEAVKGLLDWVPGEQRGKKVNVQFTYPVVFN